MLVWSSRAGLAALLIMFLFGAGDWSANAHEYGPFSHEDLAYGELPELSDDVYAIFDDAMVRSERQAERLAAEFVHQQPRNALVLYDYIADEGGENSARLHAVMLRNLLGHFHLDVELQRVDTYRGGDMARYDAVFYMGGIYGIELPRSFLRDVSRRQETFVWFRFNLNLLQDEFPRALQQRGIAWRGREGLAEPLRIDDGRPPFFDTVFYRGLPFVKHFRPATMVQTAQIDPVIVRLDVSGPAQAVVEIGNSATGEIIPYITRSGNFWFVADLPFTYSSPRDRYVVLADILHDMLGIDHPETHYAMARMEDLHTMINPEGFRRLVNLLHRQDVPFSLAIIPEYRRVMPDGSVFSLAVDEPGAAPFLDLVEYARQRGGTVLMHGVTHQYNDRPNPDNGTSAEDYEFWDAIPDRPVPDDSFEWAYARFQRGLEQMLRAGLHPVAYEMPHYHGSPAAYLADAAIFPLTYQRATYYSAEDIRQPLPANVDYEMQFFPYMIHQDDYGQVVVPENLGNLQYTTPIQTSERLLRNAAYGLAVRDGVASLFIHSYLFEPYNGIPAYSDFSRVVEDISDLGYTWTSFDDYVAASELNLGH